MILGLANLTAAATLAQFSAVGMTHSPSLVISFRMFLHWTIVLVFFQVSSLISAFFKAHWVSVSADNLEFKKVETFASR